MALEVSEPEQFWNELQAIVSKPCDSEDAIDDALREYLNLTTQHKDELLSENDIARCSYKLFASDIFAAHADYVRRQIIYGLLQEDDSSTLHLIASFLLFDGRQHDISLQMMNEEGAFARLLELIQALRRDEMDGGPDLHRILMDLLYEMSRIQRVKIEDLVLVDDDFIRCLFDIIEDLSYDVTDPYHYPVIRVLLVLNEQFMISAHDPIDGPSSSNRLTNKVIKVLSVHGSLYKTFGENIILLINREAETSLQLLTLKLLYLIFTTPSTYEYFFTNDLHVLVDILIRNLLDLPEEASALRHTYLRVLYPLTAHTQLRHPPHYKRDELRRLLSILVRGQVSYGNEIEREKILHFEEVDETTRRLVARCAEVDWLRSVEQPDPSPTQDPGGQSVTTTIDTVLGETVQQQSPVDIGEPVDMNNMLSRTDTIASSPDTASPTRMDSMDSRGSSEAPHSRRKLSAARRLGMNLEPASSSALSVQAVAAQHEKPGIITPSRKDGRTTTDLVADAPVIRQPKIKPEPPKARRWRGRRLAVDDDEAHSAGTSSDRNTIPEGVEVSPTSAHTAPTTPTPAAPPTPSDTAPGERRNSATSSGTNSHLVPPVPAPRRSASNPPPVVPPPRRSTLSNPSPSHSRPPPPPLPSASGVGKHGQKPLPPKARRWGRGKAQHGKTDSIESGTSSASIPSQPKDKETETDIVAETLVRSSQPPPSAEDTVFSDPFSPTSPTSPTLLTSPAELHSGPTITTTAAPHDEDGDEETNFAGRVSVEEAVQNVSLH